MSHFDDAELLLANLRTGAWLDEQHFPPLSWVVDGLVPEGLSVLIGAPKIGKSILALSIGLAVASGGTVLGGLPVQPRPVLMLALEDGDRRLKSRTRQLLGDQAIPDAFHYLTHVEPGLVVPTVDAWLRGYGDDKPLVVLDTLGKVIPPTAHGESAYSRDYRMTGGLKNLADAHPGMGLLALHHNRKASSDDFVNDVSGTNGIAGAADTVLVISRQRSDERGLIKVTGRDVPENEYAVQITAHGWQLIGDDLAAAANVAGAERATANLANQATEIVRFVNDNPQGVKPRDVAAALGIPAKDAGVYLGRLTKARRIERPTRGVYTPVVSVESVVLGVSLKPDTTHPTHTTLGHEGVIGGGSPATASPNDTTSRTQITTTQQASRIPEPFTVTDAMRQWAATEFPDVDIDWETDKFVNYYLAQPDECGGVKQDWGATWQLWIRRSTEMEWR